MELVLDTPFIPLRKIGLKKWFDDKEKGCYSFANNYGSLGSLQQIEKEMEADEKKRKMDRWIVNSYFWQWIDRIEILFEYERGYFGDNEFYLPKETNERFKKLVIRFIETGKVLPWEKIFIWNPDDDRYLAYQVVRDFGMKLDKLASYRLPGLSVPSLQEYLFYDEEEKIILDVDGFYKCFQETVEKILYNKNNFY